MKRKAVSQKKNQKQKLPSKQRKWNKSVENKWKSNISKNTD